MADVNGAILAALRQYLVPHGNGGGLVSPEARIEPGVYIGPMATVIGATRISGKVRLEGYTVVAGGTISGTTAITDSVVVTCRITNATVAGSQLQNVGVDRSEVRGSTLQTLSIHSCHINNCEINIGRGARLRACRLTDCSVWVAESRSPRALQKVTANYPTQVPDLSPQGFRLLRRGDGD